MGETEAFDARTIHLMDQVEAFSLEQLRQLVRIQHEMDTVNGKDTSGIYVGSMIVDALDIIGGDTSRFIPAMANILGVAVQVLARRGWLEDESVPITG